MFRARKNVLPGESPKNRANIGSSNGSLSNKAGTSKLCAITEASHERIARLTADFESARAKIAELEKTVCRCP